jgi:hypothetical protein
VDRLIKRMVEDQAKATCHLYQHEASQHGCQPSLCDHSWCLMIWMRLFEFGRLFPNNLIKSWTWGMKFWIKFLNNANSVILSGVKLVHMHIALVLEIQCYGIRSWSAFGEWDCRRIKLYDTPGAQGWSDYSCDCSICGPRMTRAKADFSFFFTGASQ